MLQHEGNTWDFFLFWSGFHVKQEEQQPKRQTDKGKVMMKKLGHTAKPTNKEEFKVEEVAGQVKLDNKFKRSSVGTTGKYSLFAKEELQPSLQLTPAADSEETKTVVEEKAAIPEDEVQTKPRSPLTILSDDEGYLLEEEQSQPIDEPEGRHGTCEEFLTSDIKAVSLIRRKTRL